ncbi:ankyrin repeat-containing domain protein [Flammula alnicola]|nr:ankyrin repeat-containing domain protein [Flammula alnicola]
MAQIKAIEACTNGDLSALTTCLSDSSITMTDDFLSNMLRNAATSGRDKIIQHLLNSYNPNHLDDKVFQAAAASNSMETFKLIYVRNPACITEFYERRGTLLAIALGAKVSKEFIGYLLSLGADPNAMSGDTISPLAYAAFQYNSPEMVGLLLQHGARVNGSSALATTAQKGYLTTAKYLLDHGAHINDPGNWMQPSFPLHIAVERSNTEMVKFLLSNGADTELRDGSGRTAFDIAREGNNTQIIDLLEEGIKLS